MSVSRALLSKHKIIVLDESTANIDVKTEEILMKKILQEFKNETVLIVAHRIHTVLDCDKILVI